MIVPEYWAEARTQKIINGKQVTLKRFGWSDSSEADAQTKAQKRVDEAFSKLESGEKVRKIDHKVPYNGAEGLPIREEIISRHNDSVITRNSYGALCINTPDVAFADIDYISEPNSILLAVSALLILASGTGLALYIQSWSVFFGTLFAALLFTTSLARLFHKYIISSKGGQDSLALKPIREFSDNHPDWHLRVYKTPMGYRVLVMHKTFSPTDDDTLTFFKSIHSDPLYVKMCKNQQCFRARVSPKPWRIGLPRITSGTGVWPIKPERMPERTQWVAKYEKLSRDYAACAFLEKLGSNTSNPKTEHIQKLHDEYCQSDKDLPIA